jgi:hypothetical protein
MPDLLAHALVAYALGTGLSWRYEWLTPPYVTALMAGAFVPDMVKVRLLVSSLRVEQVLGAPFSWEPLHFGGGVALSVLVGVLLTAPRLQRRIALLLGLGAGSHLFLDALLRTLSGYSYSVFWPATLYQPPTPGLYLSTDPWPTVVAGLLAASVFVATKRRTRESSASA